MFNIEKNKYNINPTNLYCLEILFGESKIIKILKENNYILNDKSIEELFITYPLKYYRNLDKTIISFSKPNKDINHVMNTYGDFELIDPFDLLSNYSIELLEEVREKNYALI